MKTGCEASKVHPQQRVYIQVSKKVVTNLSITIIKDIPAVTLLLVKMMLQYTRGKIWRMMGRRSSGCLLLIVKQLLFSTKIICNSQQQRSYSVIGALVCLHSFYNLFWKENKVVGFVVFSQQLFSYFQRLWGG